MAIYLKIDRKSKFNDSNKKLDHLNAFHTNGH